jgi:hypothetical protein
MTGQVVGRGEEVWGVEVTMGRCDREGEGGKGVDARRGD